MYKLHSMGETLALLCTGSWNYVHQQI